MVCAVSVEDGEVKRWIVIALERICFLFHWCWPHECRCAKWSMMLNDKWGLHEWKESSSREREKGIKQDSKH